ncbi:hypothetical protein M8R85_15875, partial [Enterobacter cloacae]|uniref:hypothetical protein n=1 Tax=Enterobacter cloacae TaxID=550 RepID=UPI0020768DB5
IQKRPEGCPGNRRETAREFSGNGWVCLYVENRAGEAQNPARKYRRGAGVTLVEFQPLSHPDSFRYVIM